MPLVSAGFPEGVYGVGVRNQLYPGEESYFKKNPHVAGMAADDNKIIMNPFSKLKDNEKQAVMMNEAARVHMRTKLIEPPNYDLTPEQVTAFKEYSQDPNDIKQTIAARILSGDPSALTPTPAQTEYVSKLRQFMGVK
jgi:ClpP class serine protease